MSGVLEIASHVKNNPCRNSANGYAFFLGTFFPFLRAYDSPIAIACLRLFTFPPFPPRPLLAVPRL